MVGPRMSSVEEALLPMNVIGCNASGSLNQAAKLQGL